MELQRCGRAEELGRGLDPSRPDQAPRGPNPPGGSRSAVLPPRVRSTVIEAGEVSEPSDGGDDLSELEREAGEASVQASTSRRVIDGTHVRSGECPIERQDLKLRKR